MKIIITFNGDIVNFRNIIEVAIMEGEVQNNDGALEKAVAVAAIDVLGQERTLGIFAKQEDAAEMLDRLKFWLTFGGSAFFEFKEEAPE
jgi:hypothetical protein